MQFCPVHKKREVRPGKKRCQLCVDSYRRGYIKFTIKQLQAGLCHCGDVRVVGYKKCANCRRSQADRSELRKVCGMCLCGKWPRLGAKSCETCLEKAKVRRIIKKEAGLCQCGRRPTNGKKVCAFCKKMGANSRNRIKQAGLCSCGNTPSDGHSTCANCRKLAMGRYHRRIREDKNFIALSKIRGSIIYGIIRSKGAKKLHRTEVLLGCTIAFARNHIEQQFPSGMTWENRELWHIDHYIPCETFDLTDERQQRLCNNWRNLRPMWEKENLQKSSKLPADYEQRLAELEENVP